MGHRRIKLEGLAHYHVISRITDRNVEMDDDEKHRFQQMMRAAEIFSGVKILTYALMRNHFHILVEVPRWVEVDEAEIIRRMRAIYTDEQMQVFLAQWELWRRQDQEKLVQAELEKLLRRRMYDISGFMKTLKQRYSMSYNGRHDRDGTLWCSRFRSVLVVIPDYV